MRPALRYGGASRSRNPNRSPRWRRPPRSRACSPSRSLNLGRPRPDRAVSLPPCSSIPSSRSRPSSPRRPTAWPMRRRKPWRRPRVARTTPCSYTATRAWVRPTCSTPSGITSTENYARRKVLYVTTETFMNDFVDSLRTSTTLAFKRRYRDCDVLLIDDVQFMERKEGLQEEFFHTYNDLKGASKQMVLTSDRPPEIHRDARGPAPEPVPLRAHHRDRPARSRNPPRHLALQVTQRAPARSPTTSSNSSPHTSKTTSVSSKGRSPGSVPSPSSTTSRSRSPRPRRCSPTWSSPANPGASHPR